MRHSPADCTLVLKASYYRHRVSNHIWARCISAVRSAVIHHCTQSNLMSFSRLCRDSVLMDLRSQSPSNINRDQWGADWEALRRLLRSCGACKQCNIRASDQTNKPHKHHMHSFSDLKRSNTCTHTHTRARAQGWWWLTSSHFINLLPRFRLSDTRTRLSWSAWTPGWAPAIQASTFTPKAAQKKISQESLSFFSGKKPERSAPVVVNGNALRARMVI